MKKSFYRISVFFLVLFLAFSSFPFQKVNAADSHINFIDFLRTNLGLAKINNGSLSNVSREDFAYSLFNTPLVWTDNGVDFSFTPSQEFTRAQWEHMCLYGSSDDTRFIDFDLQECLIKSQYIEDTGSGYDLSDFPKLDDFSDTVSPIDGVEVLSNFSDYNNYLSLSYRSVNNIEYFDIIKNAYLSNNYPLIILSGSYNNSDIKSYFYSFNSDYVFYFDYLSDNRFYPYFVIKTSSGWSSFDYSSSYLSSMTSYTDTNNNDLVYNLNRTANTNYNKITFSYSDFPNYTKLSVGTNNNIPSLNDSVLIDSINVIPSFWSNYPLVHASNDTVGKSFYIWLNGTPDGSFYTTANTNTIYNYDYVTNNNWETAYNNYISDVSNYYNTTENITNEQISNYIDNSTTINNITNNYITNNSGGDGGDGGGSFDDSVIRKWLEMIYEKLQDIESNTYGLDDFLEIISNQLNTIQEKLTDIFYWIAGKSTDPAEPHFTDDSITNDILKFPEENLFPDVPDENFISPEDIEGLDAIPWELISAKIGAVISEVVPFCYLFTLSSFMELLVAPPSAPYYEIPFVIERLNINENVIIDLTGESWQVLHGIWIALFMIMFVVFLFYLTYKVLLLISNMFV